MKIKGYKLKKGDIVAWKNCWQCRTAYSYIKHDKSDPWTPSATEFGCPKCSFEWACERYRQQFLLDLENKTYAGNDEEERWVVDLEEDRTIPRIARTLKWAIRTVGIIEAEAALLWAMQNYWHIVRTSWVHGYQSGQSFRSPPTRQRR